MECLRLVGAVLEPVLDHGAEEAAANLIAEFGSLGAILAAPRGRQMRALHEPAAVDRLQLIRAVMLHALRVEARSAPVVPDMGAVLTYLRADMAHANLESFRVLHLNVRNMIVRDQLVCEGSVDGATVHVRGIIVRALEVGAAALVLVHNHPSGDPTPSPEDVRTTRAVAAAGNGLGIDVYDHLIIGSRGHASMRSLGLL